MSEENETVVVVMEQGADWPNCVVAAQRITPNTVVIVQDEGELPAALARRVEARLRSLEREQRPVRAAVLSVSAKHDPALLEARSRISRSLLRALTGAAAATLWLSAPTAVPNAVRHHLISLAGTLTSLLGSSAVSIAARFPESRAASSASGLHAVEDVLANAS